LPTAADAGSWLPMRAPWFRTRTPSARGADRTPGRRSAPRRRHRPRKRPGSNAVPRASGRLARTHLTRRVGLSPQPSTRAESREDRRRRAGRSPGVVGLGPRANLVDGAERRCQSGIETIVRLLLRGLGVRHRHRWCHCIRASATHPPVGGAERRWDAPILMFHVKRQRCRVLTALRHALTLPRALGGAAWYLSRDVGADAVWALAWAGDERGRGRSDLAIGR
jgi:hypothetical protein